MDSDLYGSDPDLNTSVLIEKSGCRVHNLKHGFSEKENKGFPANISDNNTVQ